MVYEPSGLPENGLIYKQRHHCPALGTSGNLSNIKMDNMAIHRYLKNQH